MRSRARTHTPGPNNLVKSTETFCYRFRRCFQSSTYRAEWDTFNPNKWCFEIFFASPSSKQRINSVEKLSFKFRIINQPSDPHTEDHEQKQWWSNKIIEFLEEWRAKTHTPNIGLRSARKIDQMKCQKQIIQMKTDELFSNINICIWIKY